MATHTTPLVVLLDLDGTIIGDITPQIISFELARSLKASGAKSSPDGSDLKTKLKSGLVRPFFDTFIKTLNASNTPFEVFIYTASEKTWAEYVIKTIESTYGIKFNRPIFSRQYCIFDPKDREYKKGISLIRPTLLKALKKKYSVSFTKQDLSQNILIIDNNNVYHSADHKHLLLCPTYNYRVPENVVSYIKQDIYKSHYQIIFQVLKKYIPFLTLTSDYFLFQKAFYTYYVSFIDTQMKSNNQYLQDKYWLYLKDIIVTSGVRRFDDASVRYMTNTLRNRMGMPAHPMVQTIRPVMRQRTQAPVRQTFF